MIDLVDRMICTGFEFIDLANEMMESCRKEKDKVALYSRPVISFFIKRATEGFESFLILLRRDRHADAAILFRSFCEMGINTDYIYSDPESKEVRAMKLLVNEIREQKNILEKNKGVFGHEGLDVEERLKKKKEDLEEMKRELLTRFREKDWKWPKLCKRVDASRSEVISNIYNLAYAYTSNIEHHDMYFGRDYISVDECEPAREIQPNPLLRPDINLVMFRSILLVIMKTFNAEFHLNWQKELERLENMHEQEYREMPGRQEKGRKVEGVR
ncbi:MAG: DUF5677 domain-containing protein [Candidatus Aminicenantales bacterium]|jgi:hypothetical protein